jgi:hypothetical protein
VLNRFIKTNPSPPVAYKYPFPQAGDADAVTPSSSGWFTCSTTAKRASV